MKVYIEGSSKTSLNRLLNKKVECRGVEYNLFNKSGKYEMPHFLRNMDSGTIVAIHKKGKSPHSWGIWVREKNKIL